LCLFIINEAKQLLVEAMLRLKIQLSGFWVMYNQSDGIVSGENLQPTSKGIRSASMTRSVHGLSVEDGD